VQQPPAQVRDQLVLAEQARQLEQRVGQGKPPSMTSAARSSSGASSSMRWRLSQQENVTSLLNLLRHSAVSIA